MGPSRASRTRFDVRKSTSSEWMPHPAGRSRSGKIVGIEALATLAGETVEFDKPGAEVQGEIVSGIVNGIPYQIPTAQVEQLWLKGKNKGGITIPLLVIAAVAVMGAVSLSQNDLISFGSWECFGMLGDRSFEFWCCLSSDLLRGRVGNLQEFKTQPSGL